MNEKHKLELEKSELEQRHKIEIMELEHKNALESKEKEQSNNIVFSVLGDMLKVFCIMVFLWPWAETNLQSKTESVFCY